MTSPSRQLGGSAAESIPAYVKARLSGRVGPPHAESRGEPVWALLFDAFRLWRADPARLLAFERGVRNAQRSAYAEGDADAIIASCELLVALALQVPAWRPAAPESFPSVHVVLDLPETDSDALQRRHELLLRDAWDLLPLDPLRELFRTAARHASTAQTSYRIAWVATCWELLTRRPGRLTDLDWYPLWQTATAIGDSSLSRSFSQAALRLAWLASANAPAQRVQQVALNALGHCHPPLNSSSNPNPARDRVQALYKQLAGRWPDDSSLRETVNTRIHEVGLGRSAIPPTGAAIQALRNPTQPANHRRWSEPCVPA